MCVGRHSALIHAIEATYCSKSLDKSWVQLKKTWCKYRHMSGAWCSAAAIAYSIYDGVLSQCIRAPNATV